MSKTSELVAFAKSCTEYKQINYSTFSNMQAQNIGRITGVSIIGGIKVLDTNAIRHILKNHGNQEAETKKYANQIAVTDNDFELIPDILNTPDNVTRGKDGNRGKKALIFTKKFLNTYFLVMSISRNNSGVFVEVETLYIKN